MTTPEAPATNNTSSTNNNDIVALLSQQEARLDLELHVVRHLQRALGSALMALETIRDDLVVERNDRMDRLRRASEQCRKAAVAAAAAKQQWSSSGTATTSKDEATPTTRHYPI
jgi:hypothetical protein